MSKYTTGFRFIGTLLALVTLAFTVHGEETPARSDDAQLIERLEDRWGIRIESVDRNAVPNMYQVIATDMSVYFITDDERFLFSGLAYESEGGRISDVREAALAPMRLALLEDESVSQAIVFKGRQVGDSPNKPLYVFTDVDCGYCQLLHQQVKEYNRIGLDVHYLAYPRHGIQSKTYDKMVYAWCAKNPQKALTRLKNEQSVEAATCENPVVEHYNLGSRLGISGTPALILPNGSLVSGFAPAENLEGRF